MSSIKERPDVIYQGAPRCHQVLRLPSRLRRGPRRDSQGSGARLVLFEARLCGRLREAPQRPQGCHGGGVLTIFGVVALTFMMAMYGLESRGRTFVLTFALGCALSGACRSLSGAWPSCAVETVWVVVAVRRWQAFPHRSPHDATSEGRVLPLGASWGRASR